MKKILTILFAISMLIFTINSAFATEKINITSCVNDSHGYPAYSYTTTTNCTSLYDGDLRGLGYGIYTYSGADLIDVGLQFENAFIEYINISLPETNVVDCLNNITIRSGQTGSIIGQMLNNPCASACSTSGGNQDTFSISVNSSESSIIVEGSPACNGAGPNPPISWDYGRFFEVEIFGFQDYRRLNVYVKDSGGDFVSNILVEMQQPFSSPDDQFTYKYTDANGLAVFYPTDNNVILYIDEAGHDTLTSNVYIANGTTITKTLTLSGDYTEQFPDIITGGSYNLTGCEDILQGVWLCRYNEVTNCTTDVECATGRCMVTGHCSNFNYNLCDDDEMGRGGRCVIKQTFKGLMGSISDWILSNFFWVLVIILILLAFLVLALRNK